MQEQMTIKQEVKSDKRPEERFKAEKAAGNSLNQ